MSTGLDEILKAMEENPIEDCDLGGSVLSPEDAKRIANVLERNTSVKELDLWLNNIGDEGAIAIGNALRENKTLELLHLGWNNIGDEGCIAIAEALKKNRHLQFLNLGNKGLISLAESLKENFSLTRLWLNNLRGFFPNYFTDEGTTALLDTLDVNMTLSEVILEGTGVSDELQELIGKKTRRNKTLNAKLEVFKVSDLLEFVPFRKTKIILLGDSGSGKTHTVRELTSEEYVEERDSYTEALEISCVNSMTWEKDDQLNALELSLVGFRGQLVAEEVHSHINERRNEQDEENREEQRVLDIEEEDKLALRSSFSSHFRSLISRDKEKPSLSYSDSDSDERTIVADIYDFGGHEVYRAMSHFFMNNWAVYLIVLNLEDELYLLKSQLSYYVSVVQTFAPEASICIVGTHFSTITSSEEEVEEMVEEVKEEQATEKVVERIFYVENESGSESTSNDDKEALKSMVKVIVQKMLKEKEPKVPLLWSRMLDNLRRKREKEDIQVVKVLGLSEIELGRTYEERDWLKRETPSIMKFPPEDIDSFIELMKEIGMLYHFDTPIELNNLVILDPYWLVEGMKGVVTIKEAKKLKKENPMYATNPQWREFLGSGVLTSQLLELIASVYWKGKEEWKSYFMNLLQQQSLLYKIPDGEGGKEKYVVPPLLPKICNGSLPPMSDFFKVKLERCYPPLEVYKLSFGLVKRRGWSYDSRSTRYSILLQKEFENEKDTLISVSCDSSGMRQELSISILKQQHKSTLNKAVMDDLLSEKAL